LDVRGEGVVAELVATSEEHYGDAKVGSSFDVPARLVVSEESNATGRLVVQPSALYVDPSGVRVDVTEAEPADLGRLVLVKEPDRTLQILTAFALGVLAVLVPLALVWYANVHQSKLLDPEGLRVLQVPVRIRRSRGLGSSTFVIEP